MEQPKDEEVKNKAAQDQKVKDNEAALQLAKEQEEACLAQAKELEDLKAKLDAVLKQNESLNAKVNALKEEFKDPEPSATNVIKTITLISEAKLRVFYVDPIHVIKVIRGTKEQILSKSRNIAITPNSVVEFDEEFAKHLLSYKTFKVYGA